MPELARLHHSPNGGRRDGCTGAQMVALGVKRGWPDLVMPLPGGGCAIEMKRADGTGRVSTEQADWLSWFTACGWRAVVCTSADDARAVLCDVLDVDPASVPELG